MSHQFKTLNEVKQLFTHWRSTRTKRGKVPIHLGVVEKLNFVHVSSGF